MRLFPTPFASICLEGRAAAAHSALVVGFALGSAVAAALVVLFAKMTRGRAFAGVILTIQVVSSAGVFARLPELWPALVHL
ncbi:MAG: hypothetical protein H6716_26480 [Polyangiaceae bacterium]|nr:hypothetical protein [Polyangiaceae bacterium]